jgi:hypothetical protein
VTPLHHDTLMLFHTQVVGRKRWRLVSPLEWSRVYNHSNVFSQVDLERPDPARFPDFEQATVLEVVVEPGETMFLPLGWWHQVASLDVSLSFSYSCVAVPNHFEYPDPARPMTADSTPPTTAQAMQGEVREVVPLAGAGDAIEVRFHDGSTMRVGTVDGGIELHVNRIASRAGHYSQLVAGAVREGAAITFRFPDGSSIHIAPRPS